MIATHLNDKFYSLNTGGQIKREYTGSAAGVVFAGHWVMRDAGGDYVDHDMYINDLAERQKVRFA